MSYSRQHNIYLLFFTLNIVAKVVSEKEFEFYIKQPPNTAVRDEKKIRKLTILKFFSFISPSLVGLIFTFSM